ncbi:hypothetical protein Tco_1303087 [Tanacetum coccineum]
MAYTSSGSSYSSDSESRSDKGYHSVPPPLTGNFIPRKPDLTFIDEIVESENLDVTTVVTPSNDKTIKNTSVSNTVESNAVRMNKIGAPIIEDWNSNDESEIDYTVRPSTEKIKYVKTVRETDAPKQNKHHPRGNQRNWNNLMSQRLGSIRVAEAVLTSTLTSGLSLGRSLRLWIVTDTIDSAYVSAVVFSFSTSEGSCNEPFKKDQSKKRKLVKESSKAPSLAKRPKAGKVIKKRTQKSSLQLVDEFVDEGVLVNEPKFGDKEADMQKAVEESLKDVHAAHQGPLPSVVIREPESGKFQPLLEVQGKGKEKVGEEQVAQVLLNLQTPKKKSPADQFIFQRRTPAPTEPSGHEESSSLYAELGLTNSETESDDDVSPEINPEAQDEG